MSAPVEIRGETVDDRDSIRRVNVLAFAQVNEAELVDSLRAAAAVTLSLVAVEERAVVGHILFSPVTIDSAEEEIAAVGLGPVAVLPARQGVGIGSQLIEQGLAELRATGHDIVVVLGHADYYPRFGFVRASQFGIRWEHDVPDEVFLIQELSPGALRGRGGVVRYRPEFSTVRDD